MSSDIVEAYRRHAVDASELELEDSSSVELYNAIVDRMRSIVAKAGRSESETVDSLSVLLVEEPAAHFLSHHLVELATIDDKIASMCFDRVEESKRQATSEGRFADAMGEGWWLSEWRLKRQS